MLEINSEEQAWLLDNVNRLIALAASLEAKGKLSSTQGKERAHLEKAKTKLENSEFKFTRHELRLIERLVKERVTAYKDNIIPAYEERVIKDKAQYQSYLDKSKAMSAILGELLTKIKKEI